MQTNRFSKSQQEQLAMAASAGITDSECKKHPEWGPTLMNLCWNKERKNQSLAPVYLLADWLNQNLPRDPDTGCLYDELLVLHSVLHAYEEKRQPRSASKKPDGAFDRCMFLYLSIHDRLLASGAYLLDSGRVSINNAGWLELERIMGEGDEQAEQACSALQAWAAACDELEKKPGKPDPVSNRAFVMMNTMLALDDMNIRGYQILYALEYCGRSIEILYENTFKNRSEDLCRYVNMRSAKDYLAGDMTHNQIAVTHGASFQHRESHWSNPITLTMTPPAATAMASDKIEPLVINYAKLEIMAQMDIEQAMRIFEAHGFRLVHRVSRPGKFDPSHTIDSIILYNPKTQDYITAPSAEPENINYGGVTLTMHRDDSAAKRSMSWHCSSGPLHDQAGIYFEFTQNNGLFRHYEESLDFIPEQDFDWDKIGFDHYGVPIPKYFDLPFLRTDDLYQKLDDVIAHDFSNLGGYCFENLVNYILCLYDDALVASCSLHYRNYAKWFFREGPFSAASIGFDCSDAFITVCNAVFTWLQIPNRLIQEFMANGEAYFARDKFTKRQPGWYSQVLAQFTNDSDAGRQIIAAYNLPDPKTLPITLPWLS